MLQKRFEEENVMLEFAKHHFDGLICIFKQKNNAMLHSNKERLLCMIDIIINVLTELKQTISNDDGIGDAYKNK